MTLSHRWPPHAGQYPMLKSSTLTQFQRGINTQRLPRIFQEAMELACDLRIQYIWIDSLCIRQDEDDLSDWEKEALTMHKVYAHGFLNVSATFSSDGTGSLFYRSRSWAASRPPQIKLNVNGELQEVYLVDCDIWNKDITDAPLQKRAWVFQERFLARRVLHFGPSQVGWECYETEALELLPNGIPSPLMAGSHSKSQMSRSVRESSCSNIPISRSDPDSAVATTMTLSSANEVSLLEWRRRLIEDYSKCQMTYAKDKLIAFFGVGNSEILTQRTSDQYTSGMWRSSLIYDLAWQRIYNETPMPAALHNPEFHAPSWSWASFDGEVAFPADSAMPEPPYQFATVSDISDDPLRSGMTTFLRQNETSGGECYIDIECFLFQLSLVWSVNGDIEGITLNQFKITFMNDAAYLEEDCEGEINNFVGNFVDLNEDSSVAEERSLKRLAEVGNLFLVPLYLTKLYFQGMVVARQGYKKEVYCRIGAVQIALSAHIGEVASDIPTGIMPELPWKVNEDAMNLITYMERLPRQPEEIGDYRRIRIV
ncbi:HET-domain-containing protein [Penicillium herquei]|nr:HET-domain-containing protein [Penicillium herquei]